MTESKSSIGGLSGTLYIQDGSGTNKSWNQIGQTNGITLFSTFQKQFPKVKKVEFHNQMVTVVYWDDNTVTRVKIGRNDIFSEEYGLAMAVAKKFYGSYDRFAWSLSKAKRYNNGKKVKKNNP